MNSIYGESPLKKLLQGIDLIRNKRSASYVYVSPDAYRDIKKMKRQFKRKKSDIQLIKKTWRHHLHIEPIKFMNVELSLIDIDFMASMKHAQEAIYSAYWVPKLYLDNADNFLQDRSTLSNKEMVMAKFKEDSIMDKLHKDKK